MSARSLASARPAALVVAAVIASPCVDVALGAQSGRPSVLVAGVADAATGQPLEGAEVVLTRSLRLARANALGEAVISNVSRGAEHVRVRRLGYSPLEIDVAITGDTTGVVFRLRRSAVQLSTVDVEAGWVPPRLKDVENRRRQGIGRFLDAVQLEKDGDRDFSVVAAMRFPGLTTRQDDANHRVLFSTQGGCPGAIPIYLDDIYLGDDTDVVRTWDIAVAEFYSGPQVPVRYRTRDYGCGVLLLWSKWN